MEKLIKIKTNLEDEAKSLNEKYEELKKEYIEFIQNANSTDFLYQERYTIHTRIFEVVQEIEILKGQIRTINYSIRVLQAE